jgi:hypothetical protein
MDDLSPAFAAESLTVNIIEQLSERLESTDDYTKQLGLITVIEETYHLEEGILLSHFLEIIQKCNCFIFWKSSQRDGFRPL